MYAACHPSSLQSSERTHCHRPHTEPFFRLLSRRSTLLSLQAIPFASKKVSSRSLSYQYELQDFFNTMRLKKEFLPSLFLFETRLMLHYATNSQSRGARCFCCCLHSFVDATLEEIKSDKVRGMAIMRALLQRVSRASVTVDEQVVGRIGQGLLVLLGVGQDDSEAQIRPLADKIVHLRIFEDEAGKMNRSVLDVGGEILVVSQFTLYADTRKGRRPSFTDAAPPAVAEPLVERFKAELADYGLTVASGVL